VAGVRNCTAPGFGSADCSLNDLDAIRCSVSSSTIGIDQLAHLGCAPSSPPCDAENWSTEARAVNWDGYLAGVYTKRPTPTSGPCIQRAAFWSPVSPFLHEIGLTLPCGIAADASSRSESLTRVDEQGWLTVVGWLPSLLKSVIWRGLHSNWCAVEGTDASILDISQSADAGTLDGAACREPHLGDLTLPSSVVIHRWITEIYDVNDYGHAVGVLRKVFDVTNPGNCLSCGGAGMAQAAQPGDGDASPGSDSESVLALNLSQLGFDSIDTFVAWGLAASQDQITGVMEQLSSLLSDEGGTP